MTVTNSAMNDYWKDREHAGLTLSPKSWKVNLCDNHLHQSNFRAWTFPVLKDGFPITIQISLVEPFLHCVKTVSIDITRARF